MSHTSHEISALVQGLAAEIGRRQARGQRHTPAGARPAGRSQGLAPEKLPLGPGASAPVAARASGPSVDSQAAVSPARESVRQAAAQCGDLHALGVAVAACRACELCKTRERPSFNTVPKTPREGFEVVFVAGAPGPEEEASGSALAGEALGMLEAILTKGMRREPSSVHITPLIKCRPPGDREPTLEERATCSGFLERELELLKPKVVLALGARASEHLLKVERVAPGARGRLHEAQGQRVIPTFHPAFLIKNPERKADCWKDIKLAMEQL